MSALWVDGKKVVEQHVGTFELDTDAEIRIGVKANDGRFFKGRISCVQFYNRALSEVEIAAVKYRCLGKYSSQTITLLNIVKISFPSTSRL